MSRSIEVVRAGAVLAAAFLLTLGLGGCRFIPGLSGSSGAPVPAASVATETIADDVTTDAVDADAMDEPLVEEAGPRPSAAAIAYAKSLGGTSQEGRTLYFVIGQSLDSEAAARRELDAAILLFGDMQSYFIVQRSDNFAGMRPEWWVIIEAYRDEANAKREISLGKRAFRDAYIKKAKVLTSDPIPVYEDATP